MTHTLISPVVLMLSAAPATEPAGAAETAPPPVAGGEGATVYHPTMEIAGLDIFYREAGDPSKPTVLLLHGFPTSSHMCRNLIPALADEFHLIAPDYPDMGRAGVGHSERQRL